MARSSPRPPNISEAPASPRELVVITAEGVELRASGPNITSAAGADVGALADLIATEGISFEPHFGLPEERQRASTASLEAPPGGELLPDMALFYHVIAPDDRLEELAERLSNDPNIQAAYVKPGAQPARLNDMAPAAMEAPPATADFTARQGYLNAAPGGIDARYAWTRPGGSGAGVLVYDIEGAWNFSHEDLRFNQSGVGGTQSNELVWRNHGTAVVGEIGGDRNSFGITGIAPDATIGGLSIFGSTGTAGALRLAADRLRKGDIILIELHRIGPKGAFIAIEWWPDDLAAILYAIGRGVIVVEAAGNGAQNLDDPAYDRPQTGFPSTWRNPFRRNPVDSGAIVVGAGAPPSGKFGPDRSRLDFSNFGSMIDAQGWGREVVTTGYGDLQGGSNENLWYTAQFSGTSSASPIVVGAIACVQGFRRTAGQPLHTPASMRSALRTTGSPQQASSIAPLSQRIGTRPNLRQLIPVKVEKEKEKEILKDIRDQKDVIKDRKEVLETVKIRETFGFAAVEGVVNRIAALEGSVQQLAHFITAELRPDLATSSLSGEADLQDVAALSQELRKQAVDAKSLKDDKDLEKTRDR